VLVVCPSMFAARHVSVLFAALALASLGGVSSCLYDSAHRCEAGQIFDSAAGLCVCDKAANMIAGERGCVACGEHELAQNDACSCLDGYVRPTSSAACTLVPNALGNACQHDADCTDATYNTCHVLGDATGYCTSVGCSLTDDPCSGGYACNTTATPGYCQRPPSGVGQSCASDADCAGTDATFCEYLQGKICYVEGCSLTKNDCFPGQVCCDLTGPSFGIYKKQICAATCEH
jgi:hypothetical protein